jgi:acyl dehydratase
MSPTQRWLGRRAEDLVNGERFRIEARDTVTSAPELVRGSLNMAMAHTDAKLSYLGERLVYGGHVIFMAFAQLTRALPNLLTIIAWDSCDHTAPVVENDRLRTECSVLERIDLPHGCLHVKLGVEAFAARGEPEQETACSTGKSGSGPFSDRVWRSIRDGDPVSRGLPRLPRKTPAAGHAASPPLPAAAHAAARDVLDLHPPRSRAASASGR